MRAILSHLVAEGGPMNMERDFVGYGPNPPRVRWPEGARIAISLVVAYAQSLYSTCRQHYHSLKGSAEGDTRKAQVRDG